jgi:DNA-binding response OmpR family regulator
MRPANPILLVEDNPDDRDLTIMAFKDNNIGNRIDVARDGQEALDYLADTSQLLPALVLLDLKLPRVMGLDVLKRLREAPRTRLVPVVVLTSSREESDRYRSYVSGVNAYVQKPVDFGEFAAAVRELGSFWLVLNEPPPEERRAA